MVARYLLEDVVENCPHLTLTVLASRRNSEQLFPPVWSDDRLRAGSRIKSLMNHHTAEPDVLFGARVRFEGFFQGYGRRTLSPGTFGELESQAMQTSEWASHMDPRSSITLVDAARADENTAVEHLTTMLGEMLQEEQEARFRGRGKGWESNPTGPYVTGVSSQDASHFSACIQQGVTAFLKERICLARLSALGISS